MDRERLLRDFISADGSWSLDYSSGPDLGDVFLREPIDAEWHTHLAGAEKPIFLRSFEGVPHFKTRLEFNQKIIHALDLYWLDERQAFCRLDKHGDVEDVIKFWQLSHNEFGEHSCFVTVKKSVFDMYLTAVGCGLVRRFDFTRVEFGKFGGWHSQTRGFEEISNDTFYNYGYQSDGSYVSGANLVHSQYSRSEVSQILNQKWSDKDKKFVEFITHDWKNNKTHLCSCDPTRTSNYFEDANDKPFDTSPAFFRPEVLFKYKSDREKYSLAHRSIQSRAGWYLKSYDVNEEGQVHAYLCDLANLPFEEQLYWRSFNEEPKGHISQRAFKSDFLGQWDTTYDPLNEIKYQLETLEKTKPLWWAERNREANQVIHYPLTDSVDEWSEAILQLDQLVVEGFSQAGLRKLLLTRGIPFAKEWQSLKLVETLLARNEDDSEAAEAVEPFRTVRHLRNKTKGHSAMSDRDALVRDARVKFGHLSSHFRDLASKIHQSLAYLNENL